jgi:predicted esterase
MVMKRNACIAFVFLLAAILVSCAKATPEPVQPTINPGDEVNGMVFTAIDEIDWDISLQFRCDFESLEETDTSSTLACVASPGDRVFFGNCNGIGYDTPEEADRLWQDFELDVTFDGQALNLPPFGFLDDVLYDADKKYLRIWNVMVENITPGTHTIQCVQESEGETDTRTYVFTVADQSETFPTLSATAPHRIHPYTSERADLNYLMYIPGEYGANPGQKWPLLLYLHGMTRVNTSVNVLRNDYPLNTLADQDDFPFIVVAPQGTGEYEFWATDEMVSAIMTLLDEIQGVLAVDTSRIYLTGVSAGGNGTWEIGVRHPERFAALAPIMGYYDWPYTVPENICDLVDVPVWAFHGAKDELIPLDAEQSLVDALESCGGDVQFTVFPDVGHDLDAERVYTSELYVWLLEQTLPTSQPALPLGPDAVWHLIVIGDSSLWGLTKAFAAQIEKDVGVDVVEESFVVGGLSAGAVLQALETGESPEPKLKELPAALGDAEIVVMFVNPLDSVDPDKPLDFDGCFGFRPPTACPPESFEKYTADMQAIWAAIIAARAGQPTVLRATDIYNPLVSRWLKYDQFEACDVCWTHMSDAARLAAEAYDIPFLSRYDAFNGATHVEDPREKGYTISDGEHPSDLASRYTAELLSQMGYEPVTGP